MEKSQNLTFQWKEPENRNNYIYLRSDIITTKKNKLVVRGQNIMNHIIYQESQLWAELCSFNICLLKPQPLVSQAIFTCGDTDFKDEDNYVKISLLTRV